MEKKTHKGKLLSSFVFMKRNNMDIQHMLDSGVAEEEYNKDSRDGTLYITPGEKTKMKLA